MREAQHEHPQGFLYQAGLLTREDERLLLERIETLRFDPIVLHGREARRTARHFGLDYDYEKRLPRPGEPLPGWLGPARVLAGALAGRAPDEFVEALVQRFPPGSTIGWHRDAPAFGDVVGLSLKGRCRLRFQRGTGERRRVWETMLEPRSGYVLAGESRRAWQHSIPPTRELRFSVTFRTLRGTEAR